MRKILIFILLLAAFFRFYQLNRVPPSPSLDEVSIGWNAYSILKTDKDEYGTKLPILLRAYDDWRPALYVYLVIPAIKIFGLNAFAVRFPAALLGTLTVLITYFLVRELFFNSLFVNLYSLIASLLLAISPWHIYLSRLGHEVNAGLTFSVLGIFFFLKFINLQKAKWLYSAAIFFSLSFYTYQSQKIFGPLIIISLVWLFRKKLLFFKKETFLATLLGLVLLFPILKASVQPEALIRFKATSVFRPGQNPAKIVFQSYLSHFKPKWLFLNSGAENHKMPRLGIFYLWEGPLLLLGLYQLIKSKLARQNKIFLLSWLLIAPLPASVTTGAPHAMRIFNVLPVPQILAALGLVVLWKKIKWLSLALVLASSVYLFKNYFIIFPREQSASFQYPLGQVIPWVLSQEQKYQKIVFSNQKQGYQSYMFFLFFSQYDPKIYLENDGTFSGGYNETHKIGKYEFRPIEWEKEDLTAGRQGKNSLLIGNINDFPENTPALKTFSFLDGQGAIKCVSLN